jgi:hypothetical protein
VSFFVGLLLSSRVMLSSNVPSGCGSRIPLFSDDCDQSRCVKS